MQDRTADGAPAMRPIVLGRSDRDSPEFKQAMRQLYERAAREREHYRQLPILNRWLSGLLHRLGLAILKMARAIERYDYLG